MMHLNPLVLVGAVIGVITALLVAAYAAVKDKKTAMGFERTMADGEILRRLRRDYGPLGKETAVVLTDENLLLPLLYALVLGGILSFPKFGILKFSEMDRAAKFMPIAMLVLLTKIGLGIGPNLEMLLNSGWALIMQEFGHFFGTLIFGLPVALSVFTLKRRFADNEIRSEI